MNKLYLCNCGKTRSHEFLFFVLKTFYGITAEETSLRKTEYGKLYLTDCPIKFNVSHTSDLVVLAVGSDELGVDVEQIREKDFTKASAKYFGNQPKTVEEFFTLWTKAESFVKYMASSVLLSLKKIEVIGNEFIYDGIKQTVKSKSQIVDGYVLSVTANEPNFEIININNFE